MSIGSDRVSAVPIFQLNIIIVNTVLSMCSRNICVMRLLLAIVVVFILHPVPVGNAIWFLLLYTFFVVVGWLFPSFLAFSVSLICSIPPLSDLFSNSLQQLYSGYKLSLCPRSYLIKLPQLELLNW